MVQKVIVATAFCFIVSMELAIATDDKGAKTKKDEWVDSVFASMTTRQKVGQLLFLMNHTQGEIPEVGGVITSNTYVPTIAKKQAVAPFIGYRPSNYIFADRGTLDVELIAATQNPVLINEAARFDASMISSEGFDFVYLPQGEMPPLVQDESITEHLRESYLIGIEQSTVELWSDVSWDDEGSKIGLDLKTYLTEKSLTLDRITNKQLKRLSKDPHKGILYYLTDPSDEAMLNGLKVADVLLINSDPEFYQNEILNWLNKKKLKSKYFDRKVKKVLASKYEAKFRPRVDTKTHIEKKIFNRKLNELGTVVVRNDKNKIPVSGLDNKNFASLSLGVFDNLPFQENLDHYNYFSHFGEADFLHDENNLRLTLSHYDYVVTGFSFPDFAALDNEDVRRRVRFLQQLSEETEVIVVVLAGSRWVEQFSFARSLLLTYQNDEMSQGVATQIIFGALPGTGKLPFDLSENVTANTGVMTPSLKRLGYVFPEYLDFDPLMERKIDFIIRAAIDSSATPGCQVLVARDGKVVLEKAYGHHTYDSIQPVTTKTIYDIASVTKVTGTLQATMFLEGRKRIDLDNIMSDYLPELEGTNKENLVVRKVLTHQAGLQSYFPFYRKTFRGDGLNPTYYQNRPRNIYNQEIAPGLFGHEALEDSVWSWTIHSRLRKKPDWQEEYDYRYSDLGFFMMQKLNERLLNQPLEEFLGQNFYEPLGMFSTGYQPLCRFPRHSIAPTEVDYDFRNSLVWGMVHDENAALTGGVGGHAGLFSTANDLAILLQMNLQDGVYGGTKYLEKGTIEKFTKKQYAGNRRGLGWDKAAFLGDYRNTSNHSSHDTFGHLGFTGTAVWVDPKYQLIYVFLSNRVHPNRENDKLMVDNIRSRIHDVIYQSMPEFRRGS